jgi:hypothetical protein
MSNTTTGPGAKKETVYSGPGPQPRLGAYNGPTPTPEGSSVYGGPAPKPSGGTVYNGPTARGTVFSGPGTSGPGTSGTVYNPARLNPAERPGKSSADAGGSRAGAIFFVIAGFSALNTLLILAGSPIAIGMAATRARAESQLATVLILNVIVIAIFVALGVFAGKGSKAAFLIGLLLYGGDTVLLCLADNPAAHVPAIVVHGFFMVAMFRGFRRLS